MDATEFNYCYELACKGRTAPDRHGKFMGYGLPDFGKCECTPEEFAGLIVWQTFCFDGSVDSEALRELKRYRQRFDLIVDVAKEDHVEVEIKARRRAKCRRSISLS